MQKDYDMATACNTYTLAKISNAKDPEVLAKTDGIACYVYTQDGKLQHEDRFLFAFTTMSSLHTIQIENPTHKFTAEINMPALKTIDMAMERMLQNTLCQIASAFVVRVYGGSVDNNDEKDTLSAWDSTQKGAKCIDLSFATGNMVLACKSEIFIFEHYAATKKIEPKASLILFNAEGLPLSTPTLIELCKPLNATFDPERFTYDLALLTRAVFHLFKENRNLKFVHFNVQYEEGEQECAKLDVELVKNFCKRAGIIFICEQSNVIAFRDY